MLKTIGLLVLSLGAMVSASEAMVPLDAPAMDRTQQGAEAPAALGWRSFPTCGQAMRFERLMRCRGYATNRFYDPAMCWWVVEYF